MVIKGIFFDLIGTLVDCENFLLATKMNEEVVYSFLCKYKDRIDCEKFNENMSNYFNINVPFERRENLTVYEYRLKYIANQFGIELGKPELQNLAIEALRAWEKTLIIKQTTIELLQNLKLSKIIALITNFDHPPFVYYLLEKYNLGKLFKSIIISGEFGLEKPDGALFYQALSDTFLLPNEVIYVGDSIEHDINGALAIGMIPIHKNTKRKDSIKESELKKEYIINDLKNLPDMIKKIEMEKI